MVPLKRDLKKLRRPQPEAPKRTKVEIRKEKTKLKREAVQQVPELKGGQAARARPETKLDLCFIRVFPDEEVVDCEGSGGVDHNIWHALDNHLRFIVCGENRCLITTR